MGWYTMNRWKFLDDIDTWCGKYPILFFSWRITLLLIIIILINVFLIYSIIYTLLKCITYRRPYEQLKIEFEYYYSFNEYIERIRKMIFSMLSRHTIKLYIDDQTTYQEILDWMKIYIVFGTPDIDSGSLPKNEVFYFICKDDAFLFKTIHGGKYRFVMNINDMPMFN